MHRDALCPQAIWQGLLRSKADCSLQETDLSTVTMLSKGHSAGNIHKVMARALEVEMVQEKLANCHGHTHNTSVILTDQWSDDAAFSVTVPLLHMREHEPLTFAPFSNAGCVHLQ